MKKNFLLLRSIILFFVSLFFIVGVLVFIGHSDLEGIIIMGIPSLLFGTLFYKTLKKYLIMTNFKFSDFILKWKNSKFLKIIDIILSFVFYVLSLTASAKNETSLFCVSIIISIFFGLLYIFKPLLGNNINFETIKKKLPTILIYVILFIMITLLSNYYLGLRINWGVENFDWSILDTYDSGLEKIVFLVLYGISKLLFRAGLIVTMSSMVYMSLLLYIKNCFDYNFKHEQKIKFYNICSLCMFVIIIIIHNDVIFKSFNLIIFNVLNLILLITNVLKIHKESNKNNNIQ